MKRNASNYERDLLRRLWDLGFVAFRIAGSGSSSYPSADVIAVKSGKVYVFEVKTTRSNRVYINQSQLWELEKILSEGIDVFVAVRFIGSLREWRLLKLQDVLEHGKVSIELAKEKGMRIEELASQVKKS